MNTTPNRSWTSSPYRLRLWKFFRHLRHGISISIKVGLGSALAILIAQALHLSNATSAGSITLLTLIAGTRKETIRLIFWRMISFLITVSICAILFPAIPQIYLAYALFLFLDVFILEVLGWQSTLSVNAVIGVHFLINRDFSIPFIVDEFLLLLIGTLIAFLLNLIQPVLSERERLYNRIRQTEKELEHALHDISSYLRKETPIDYALKDLTVLKDELNENIQLSSTFAQNSFKEDDKWFLHYFEARLLQCMLLRQLHDHIKAIREIPANGKLVADYIDSLCEVVSMSIPPDEQIKELDVLIEQAGCRCDRSTHFQNQAMLYHVLLDLQEYLRIKKGFFDSLNASTLAQYQNKDHSKPSPLQQAVCSFRKEDSKKTS